MAFPITELLDEQACYEFLLGVLHPRGLQCPAGHRMAAGQAPHMSDRAPVVDYRCRRCGKVFNLFTSTLWKGTHYSCRQIVLLGRGFAQGVPTLHLARELRDGTHAAARVARASAEKKSRRGSPIGRQKRTRCFKMRAKKARPSKTRKTSHGVAPTTAEAWGPWLMIGPRFKAWSDARLGRFGKPYVRIPSSTRFNRKWNAPQVARRRSTRMSPRLTTM